MQPKKIITYFSDPNFKRTSRSTFSHDECMEKPTRGGLRWFETKYASSKSTSSSHPKGKAIFISLFSLPDKSRLVIGLDLYN